MTLQAFALLCALATLYCVAGAPRLAALGYVAGGMLVCAVLMLPALFGLPLAPLLAVEPAQVALLLTLFALARLRGQVDARIVLFIGGALAVVWMQALRGLGWPLLAALPFVLCVTAAGAVLGLKREFFPPRVRDEVTLLLLIGGLLVALVPGILGGWDSAQGLQGNAQAASVGNRVVWIAGGFVILGAAFAWWKSYRRWN